MGKQRRVQSQAIMTVIAVLGLIIAFVSIPWWKDWFNRIEKKPAFTFTYEGAFEQSKPEYEVAFPLGWSGQVPSTSRIIVNASYTGHELQGPVYVKIQPADQDRPAVQVAEWPDFENQSGEPVVIPLDFPGIFDYAGLSEDTSKPDMTSADPWGRTRGQFEIYVEYRGEKQASEVVTVWNTPWFHEVYLSDYEFSLGAPVDAFIRVMNHGEGSEFEVNSCLFKISTPTFSLNFDNFTSQPDGWWPEKGLERACNEYQTTRIAIPRASEKIVVQPVPAETIREEGVFALVTYVLKKLPIIQYDSNEEAFDARDMWLVRDGRQYVSFVVLKK